MHLHPAAPSLLLVALTALPATANAGSERQAEALEEVRITATPLGRGGLETAQPVLVVGGDDLLRKRSGTLADTLSQEPGLSATSFGPIASRPVIRGQGGLRVQVFQDGADVLDAASLSEDHAVTLDPLLAERIEVVRGPAALLFGNAASAGAVNVVTRRIPTVPLDRPFSAALEARGDSAADTRALGAHATAKVGEQVQVYADMHDSRSGDLHIPGYAWSDELRADLAAAGEAFDGSRDRLPNSDGRSQGGSLGIAWLGERQKYGFSASRYDSDYGLPGPGEEPGASADIRLDMTQRRYDASAEWRPSTGIFDAVRLHAARNDYAHAELEPDGSVGTRYAQVGDELRLTAEHGVGAAGRGVFGMQMRGLDFRVEGVEAFLPSSETLNTGFFAFQEHRIGALTLEAGARYERQRITTPAPATLPRYGSGAFGGSLGALWTLRPEASLALQLTRTERHPTATELYAHGAHLAVRRYEIGDAELRTERGLTVDLELRLGRAGGDEAGWRGRWGIFHGDYDRYIAARPTGGFEDGLPVVEFGAGRARFTGAEFELGHDALHQTAFGALGLRLFGDLVRAEDGTGEPLPQIPPLRLGAEAALTGERLRIGVEAVWNDRQDRTARGERSTAGFTLLGVEASWRRPFGDDRSLSLFLRGSNLLDAQARRHASPLKDYAPLAGRAVSGGLRLEF